MASFKELNDSLFYRLRGAEANVYCDLLDGTFVHELIHDVSAARKSLSSKKRCLGDSNDSASPFKKILLDYASTSAKPKESSSSATNFSCGAGGSSPSLGNYEVFLSFRGPDTRKGFVDHLYRSLRDAGVNVFRDSDNLHAGEEIGVLLNRIKQFKIAIPVFSESYAKSKWCLREVSCMMDCWETMGQTVLPIFYNVEPNDVQYQTGYYKAAFDDHEKNAKQDSEIDVRKWREALLKIGKLSGWHLKEVANGHEGELVLKVVQRVRQDLKKGHLQLTQDLVSVDDQIVMVKRLLELEKEDVRIIGFYGMGGIGKTTLAKVIYNEILKEFDGCSFLQDIRENSSPMVGLVCLQSRLVADLSRREGEKFSTTSEGIMALRSRFRENKVLIVLDDVNHDDQLQALVSADWFGPGSRVIVTTRNKNVLCLTSEEWKYEVKELEPDQAMELFCKHAFKADSPPDDKIAASNAIVEKTGGLPLALQLMGSMLHKVKENEDVWEETLKKLSSRPLKDIEKTLRISYDSLELEQQIMFLDIACFFSGTHREFPMLMWEACQFYPKYGLHELIQRSLVKVLDDDKLWMHDQLRDLGRKIVQNEDAKQLGNRSRLWESEEVTYVLEECKGSANVEVICPPLEPRNKFRLEDKTFRNMPNLRFLQMDCADLEGNFKNVFRNLRYLRLRYSSFINRPINLDMKNLVVLHISWSVVDQDWDGWKLIKNALKLKVLILSHCWGLSVIEPSTSCLPNSLTVLTVDYCQPLAFMNLSNLAGLTKLHLHECLNLQGIVGLGMLVALKELFILNCVRIAELPNLSKLKSLTELRLKFCLKLQQLEGLDELVALEKLTIGLCTEIEKLPNMSKLKSLRKMKVYECENLREVEGLDELINLEKLSISKCQRITRLSNLSNLKTMRELWVIDCRKLRGLDGLDGAAGLEVLIIDGCIEIDRLQNISSLKSLKYLSADGCEKLQGLERVQDDCEALEFVKITGSRAIPDFPEPDMSMLKEALRRYEGGR